MTLKNLLLPTMLVTFFSTTCFAIEFDKPILAKILLKPGTANHIASMATKPVYLMNLKLTPAQRQQFTQFETLSTPLVQGSNGLPTKADVGMNNTPVLDQGQHGSCVT